MFSDIKQSPCWHCNAVSNAKRKESWNSFRGIINITCQDSNFLAIIPPINHVVMGTIKHHIVFSTFEFAIHEAQLKVKLSPEPPTINTSKWYHIWQSIIWAPHKLNYSIIWAKFKANVSTKQLPIIDVEQYAFKPAFEYAVRKLLWAAFFWKL